MEKNNGAKRDFGSFHSSNVEELIHLSESEYKSPKLDVAFDLSVFEKFEFGSSDLKKNFFYLDERFCFLNHGAFGLSFKPVLDYVHEWKCYAESQPLRFYDRQIMPLLVDLIRKFSSMIFKCKPNELALVDNCTFAFNSLISSLDLSPGDKIFIFSTTYGVYKKILKDYCIKKKAILIEEAISFPIIDEKDLMQKTLGKFKSILSEDEEDKKIRLVLIDHIPSNQPFLVPIDRISEYCKSKRSDILFVVDAAHSLGSVKNFTIDQYPNIDIMFTNCHKWFCGPKGTGFLYVKEISFRIRPSVQSHGINSGFNSEFIWSGLKDYASFLGLYASLNIWLHYFGGFDKPIEYCYSMVRQASEYLKNLWQTSFMVDPSLCSTMVCVQLPDSFVRNIIKNDDLESSFSYNDAEIVQNFFYFSHSIEVPIKYIQNSLYVRLSAHIYNKIEDYEFLGDVVMQNVE
ncbi:L-cysteine desulfhydrase 1 isoform X2 [Brachionus plicatilis]|uniref:L-cysteine desulfhydrase 1 isoform X2 n=1 Tax=Brachionus plicatilis TaxID=10195 RepID=A0A3M7QUP7_BRAPC|nr:L-cysteine desulfhydrase 1 isoform X2 [Brachionus plicatilis]